MASVEWRPEFATGIADVDHEHRELIGWINQTLAAAGDTAGDPGKVGDLLGEVFARISAHFALEEHIMSARRYDQFAEHKRDHEHLLDDIRDIMDDVEAAGGPVEERFSARLSEWFGAQFRTHDARFHQRMPGA
ncbi:MAG: hemerythrin family protein [Gammaproteobacteria bacterium]|nr:hemerythrin family protein [Gammaproteobacteria bacterium]